MDMERLGVAEGFRNRDSTTAGDRAKMIGREREAGLVWSILPRPFFFFVFFPFSTSEVSAREEVQLGLSDAARE